MTEQMFDSIAHSYDGLNHWLSAGADKGWRRRSLGWFVERERPQAILDVACGTGDFSIAIARHSHPDTRVWGVDLSERMLEVMRRKVTAAGLEGRIGAERGNGEELRFADSSFDCVTVAFGIRNFEHRERALHEMHRVLRKGGKVVILELSEPSNPVLRWCYNLYFARLLPLVGGWVSGQREAYSYLPRSVAGFPGKEEWMETMRRCGFVDVRHRAFTLGVCRLYVGCAA